MHPTEAFLIPLACLSLNHTEFDLLSFRMTTGEQIYLQFGKVVIHHCDRKHAFFLSPRKRSLVYSTFRAKVMSHVQHAPALIFVVPISV